MTQFEDREKSFEEKFRLDEELDFKVAARAAHLFSLWAAGQMGMTGEEAEAYARQASEMIVAKSGRENLMRKTEKDLRARDIRISRHRLEKEMESFYQAAREQIIKPKEK